MKIIGITGGKGGTGKSTVATALAYELSQKHKVLLVDADVDCPNDYLLLSIEQKKLRTVKQRIPKFDLSKCIKCGSCGKVCKTNAIVSITDNYPIFMPDQCNGCGACQIACSSGATRWESKELGSILFGKKDNLDLLSGELKINQQLSEFIVRQLNIEIDKIQEKYDYIIIDTAAGTHCPVMTALEHAEKVIAVTEPSPLGAHDLEAILQLFSKMKKSGSIVINKSDIGDKKIIKALALKYHTKLAFEMRFSKEIINSYSKGIPIAIKNITSIINEAA